MTFWIQKRQKTIERAQRSFVVGIFFNKQNFLQLTIVTNGLDLFFFYYFFAFLLSSPIAALSKPPLISSFLSTPVALIPVLALVLVFSSLFLSTSTVSALVLILTPALKLLPVSLFSSSSLFLFIFAIPTLLLASALAFLLSSQI